MEPQCAKCEAVVSESASRCSNCGYDPGRGHKWRGWLYQLVGLPITLSVIGAPIGLWIQWRGYKRIKRARTATAANPSD